MKDTRLRLKRTGVLLGVVASIVGAALLIPASASAAAPIGKDPGHLAFNPTSGPMASQPTWSTDTACSTSFNSSAKLQIVKDNGTLSSVSGTVTGVTSPFSGTLQGQLSQFVGIDALVAGHTYEFVVQCQTASLATDPEQSEFLTISADGTTYTTSATPPSSGPTTTTTTLAANPTTAGQGQAVSLTATVAAADTAGNDAAGSVQFFNGTTSLGTAAVSGGTATTTVSTLPVGADSITAVFTPTSSTAFAGSTSAPVTVTITAAAPGTETINVGIAAVSSGSLTLTVSNTPVSMSTPTNAGTHLDSTGTLSPVTVSDSRLPDQPGWNATGQVSDFTSGSNVLTGNALGWTPSVTTPNTANDVTAGTAVVSNSPGLKTAAVLAAAAAHHGGGTTVLGAGLDLQIPFTQAAGNYSATLTVTLLSL
ncbi:MAG TPA: Ig-like domain-containing protein [Pseudonocardiaceae bacterium]|jgi:hypothetical protein|nr:Ig-like domain-containing protein [Pseudonocardiaceae bacterium]